MIRRLADLLLERGLPFGETGESIRADLLEELRELQERSPGRSHHAWLLWEAIKLKLHFLRLRLEERGLGQWAPSTDKRGRETVMGSFGQDTRFAFRTLRRRPTFSAVSILTLGLGIGAATAMFSVVDGILIRSVPFEDPGELVNVWATSEGARGGPGLIGRTWDKLPLSLQQFRLWQAENTTFQGVAVHNAIETTLSGADGAERIRVGHASASLLPVLGVRPVLGRWFLPGEEGTENGDAAPVTVVSYETWRDRLGSDPAALGRTLLLDGRETTIIGVMPPGFRLRYLGMHWLGEDREGARDVWVPIGTPGLGNGNNLEAIARLSPDVPVERALAEATEIFFRIRDRGTVRIVPRTEDETSGLGGPLLLLLAATGLLLLVGCANIATLALGELHGRAPELSTRAALGAGKGRIARQLLVESLILGLLGSGVGLLLAYGGTGALVALAPPLPRVETVGVDLRVLGFAVLVGVSAGVLFGTLPALLSARASHAGASSPTRTTTGRRGGLERWIVSAEIALTVVLLVSGGLLARSLQRLLQVDPGFQAQGLAAAEIYLPGDRYPRGPDLQTAYDEILARVRALPAAAGAAVVTRLPFPGHTNSQGLSFPGREEGESKNFGAQQLGILPGYHELMGIPILAGKDISQGEEEAPGGILLTENIARLYWPAGTPIGATTVDGARTVVGVVGNVKRNALGAEPDRAFYYSLRRRPSRSVNIVARAGGDALALAREIRATVQSYDPGIPVRQVTTLPRLIRESAAEERYRTLLMGVFGCLATLLAAVGIFGVTARSVAQRTREMGVRMSLGAQEGSLVGMLVRRAAVTGVAGTLAGLLMASLTGRLLSGFLFGIDPFDPFVYLVVAGFLGAVSLSSSFLPARKIASLDPAEVLRAE